MATVYTKSACRQKWSFARVERIVIYGRRGWLNVDLTIVESKEIREISIHTVHFDKHNANSRHL